LDRGRNVLVSAPTGSGKTVVAEHAVELALAGGGRCFYTAPIKALSNQKFNDLRAVLGDGRVGLLTGDHSINADAPIVVMTTEVLRNMVYSRSSALDGLSWVVLDEVHFLSDAYRGPVWEEVLIHTPVGAGFVCLSATVSNAEELGDWIEALRGPTDTIVEHERPIQLDPLLLVGDRTTEREHLFPLLVNGRPNPEGHRFDADRPTTGRGGAGNRGRTRSRYYTPRRVESIERLLAEDLLPTIYFIFSRNGCDEAAGRYLDTGPRLTSAGERDRIRWIVEERTRGLSDDDLDVLGYDRWSATLEHGVAAHHAGMIPAFRETVEQCFVEGLLRAVFATETLALGINMPARSVLIERLSKYNGETHEFLSAGQFTQLTGRAGRRGIDEQGAAVVLWSPFATFEQVASLAASKEFPLASSFRPTYNMTANLVERYDEDEAHRVLSRSFAQFQADRAAVRLRARGDRLRLELEELRGGVPVAEQVFDVDGYARLREAARRSRRENDRGAIERALARLAPGDVVERVGPRGPRLLVVLAVSQRRGGSTRIRATGTSAHPVDLDVSNAGGPLAPLARVELPVPYQPKDPGYRRRAAEQLRRLNPRKLRRPETSPGTGHDDPRTALLAHPLHHHPDRDQLLAGHRSASRIERELGQTESEVERRGAGLVRQFDGIMQVLDGTGHVDGWQLTDAGRQLRRIYHECDLLISIALERGLFDGLTPPGVAAFASCLTYEHRSSDPAPPAAFPDPALRRRFTSLEQLWNDLNALEKRHRVPLTRAPEPGFAAAAWAWAEGTGLDGILDEDLTGGDFVRNVRQLVDLLRQLAEVATDARTRSDARSAAEALMRGVIVSSAGPE
jgi:ATP-dependent RNA helicase HelY